MDAPCFPADLSDDIGFYKLGKVFGVAADVDDKGAFAGFGQCVQALKEGLHLFDGVLTSFMNASTHTRERS